jgi:uncharacterized protein YbjT (DUF2867 family)
MILVVGATGNLGNIVAQQLAGKGVRALVRRTSASDKVEALRRAGAETVVGDLKDRASLEAACKGIKTLISTASATLSRADGDSLHSVDLEGQSLLIDVAKAAGVEHFVFLSFPPGPGTYPLQTAKRAIEKKLQNSGMKYTILQPTNFSEAWLSPALGFDFPNATARIYGSGENKVSWISIMDVARFVVDSVGNGKMVNKVVQLGGPEALSYHEVVKIFEDVSGKKFTLEHVPAEALEKQRDNATDPMEKTFAALMFSAASGSIIDTKPALELLPGKLAPVRDWAKQALGK